jgi:hypothetical protein
MQCSNNYHGPGSSVRALQATGCSGTDEMVMKHLNPFSTEPVLQITLFSVAQTWVHAYAITCWTKQAMDVNFQV